MFWLIFGLIIWADVHFFRRVLPQGRKALDEALGANGAKGLIAIILIISVIMMTIGYRQMGADGPYTTPHWTHYIAIILNFVAIVLMGAANSKSRVRGLLRHPMLTGVIIWSIAHLLVTGSWRSIILWGGMLIWSIAEIRLINKQEPEYAPYSAGTPKGDIRLLLISALIAAVIMGLHHWILGH